MLLSHFLMQWSLFYNLLRIKTQFNIVLIRRVSEVILQEFSLTKILFSVYDTVYSYRYNKSLPINNTNLVRRKSLSSFSCNFISFHLILLCYLIHFFSFINIYCIPSCYNVHAITTNDT